MWQYDGAVVMWRSQLTCQSVSSTQPVISVHMILCHLSSHDSLSSQFTWFFVTILAAQTICVDAASVKLYCRCSTSSTSGKIVFWSMSPFKGPYWYRVYYSMTKHMMSNTSLHQTLCNRRCCATKVGAIGCGVTREDVKPVNTYTIHFIIIIQYFLITNTLDMHHTHMYVYMTLFTRRIKSDYKTKTIIWHT